MPAKTHGQSKRTRLYSIWANMKQRCLNPNNPAYTNYGGRGIQICGPWRDSFEAFATDMGPAPSPKHSINRIDNNGNYEPGNVEWADDLTQAQNSRRATPVLIDGATHTINEWLRRNGIPYTTYKQRRRNGWDIVKALTYKRPAAKSNRPNRPKQPKLTDKSGPQVWITIEGRTQRLCDWLRELNVSRELYKSRRRLGWSYVDALTKPKKL